MSQELSFLYIKRDAEIKLGKKRIQDVEQKRVAYCKRKGVTKKKRAAKGRKERGTIALHS